MKRCLLVASTSGPQDSTRALGGSGDPPGWQSTAAPGSGVCLWLPPRGPRTPQEPWGDRASVLTRAAKRSRQHELAPDCGFRFGAPGLHTEPWGMRGHPQLVSCRGRSQYGGVAGGIQACAEPSLTLGERLTRGIWWGNPSGAPGRVSAAGRAEPLSVVSVASLGVQSRRVCTCVVSAVRWPGVRERAFVHRGRAPRQRGWFLGGPCLP